MSARILLTGASGFLGANVLRRLIAERAEVAVLLRDPGSAWRIREELAAARVVRGDLADAAGFEGEVASFAPTHLVHLAWEGVAGGQRNDPAQHRNVTHAMRLLEIAMAAGVRHFVGLGSQAEYGLSPVRASESAVSAATGVGGSKSIAALVTAVSQTAYPVIAIIVDKLGVDQGEVTPEASFTNDLGADSLDTVELIMEFEKEFNIAIPDDQAEKIQTVGQAVDYVEKNAK